MTHLCKGVHDKVISLESCFIEDPQSRLDGVLDGHAGSVSVVVAESTQKLCHTMPYCQQCDRRTRG